MIFTTAQDKISNDCRHFSWKPTSQVKEKKIAPPLFSRLELNIFGEEIPFYLIDLSLITSLQLIAATNSAVDRSL